MKKSYLMFATVVIVAALSLGFGPTEGEDAATAASRTLTGEFAWSDRTTGDLKAVFEPNGEDAWDVSFYFEFRGQPHTYTGTATGSLEDGSLEGRVQNENKKRTWEFSGAFEGDTYSGEHWEITGGDRRATGTLSLSG